jgi:hypothetical protein
MARRHRHQMLKTCDGAWRAISLKKYVMKEAAK